MARVKVQLKRCSPSRIVQDSALCAIIPLRMKKQPSIPLNVAFGLSLERSRNSGTFNGVEYRFNK